MSASGNLVIKGDNLGNAVAVTFVAEGLAVRGFEWDGEPTMVNGQPEVIFPGPQSVVKNLRVTTKGGDDVFSVDADVGGSVSVNTSAGADHVEVANTVIGRNLSINLGSAEADHDRGGVFSAQVGGNVSLKGGRGRHLFEVQSVSSQKRIAVNLGQGDDQLDLFNSTASAFKLNGGSGEDVLRVVPGGGSLFPSRNFEQFG